MPRPPRHTPWPSNRRALERWYPHVLQALRSGPRERGARALSDPPGRLRRATRSGAREPSGPAGTAGVLIVIGFGSGRRLSKLLDQRPPGSTTLVIEPDRAGFRELLARRDLTAVLAHRRLRLTLGDDPLSVAAAVMALPEWVEPVVVEMPCAEAVDGPTARARRVVDAARALAHRRHAASAADAKRWVSEIRRHPERLLRMPLVFVP